MPIYKIGWNEQLVRWQICNWEVKYVKAKKVLTTILHIIDSISNENQQNFWPDNRSFGYCFWKWTKQEKFNLFRNILGPNLGTNNLWRKSFWVNDMFSRENPVWHLWTDASTRKIVIKVFRWLTIKCVYTRNWKVTI